MVSVGNVELDTRYIYGKSSHYWWRGVGRSRDLCQNIWLLAGECGILRRGLRARELTSLVHTGTVFVLLVVKSILRNRPRMSVVCLYGYLATPLSILANGVAD